MIYIYIYRREVIVVGKWKCGEEMVKKERLKRRGGTLLFFWFQSKNGFLVELLYSGNRILFKGNTSSGRIYLGKESRACNPSKSYSLLDTIHGQKYVDARALHLNRCLNKSLMSALFREGQSPFFNSF